VSRVIARHSIALTDRATDWESNRFFVSSVQLAALRREEWTEGGPQSARVVPPKHQGYN
jgi:hypothetical protein